MKSISHTRSFDIAVPIDGLFPLFTPEGEKVWVPGWDYQNIMGTTDLSEDYVFLTRAHDHHSRDAIWIVKKFDPISHCVQYYRIEPEVKVGVVTVECAQLENDRTEVKVTYKYTALSAVGEQFVSEYNQDVYEDFIHHWEALLNTYFDHRHQVRTS